MRIVKAVINFIDAVIMTVFPVTPKMSDNFAFKNEAQRQEYYDTYGLPSKPTKKATVSAVLKVLAQGFALFLALIAVILAIAYFGNH